jgi:hypothetical protein
VQLSSLGYAIVHYSTIKYRTPHYSTVPVEEVGNHRPHFEQPVCAPLGPAAVVDEMEKLVDQAEPVSRHSPRPERSAQLVSRAPEHFDFWFLDNTCRIRETIRMVRRERLPDSMLRPMNFLISSTVTGIHL